jgi:hypothetical protein
MKYLKLYEEFKFLPKVMPSEPNPEIEVEPDIEPDTMPLPPTEPDYEEIPEETPDEPDEIQRIDPDLEPDPQARKKREEELMHKVYKKYKKLHEKN